MLSKALGKGSCDASVALFKQFSSLIAFCLLTLVLHVHFCLFLRYLPVKGAMFCPYCANQLMIERVAINTDGTGENEKMCFVCKVTPPAFHVLAR